MLKMSHLLLCLQESHGNGGGGGIRVTAASRGIIQRDHQKSALFYKGFSAGNPFDAVSKKELDDYVHDVQRKTASPVPPCENFVLIHIKNKRKFSLN